MFDLAWKVGSEWFYFFPRRQRHHREKDYTNPCQGTEGCSEGAGAHVSRLIDPLSGLGKSGPGRLAPMSLASVLAKVAGSAPRHPVTDAIAHHTSPTRASLFRERGQVGDEILSPEHVAYHDRHEARAEGRADAW